MEFAIVAPVLVLLIFGMIEYGRLVMVQQILTNASREGAREAVFDGATATDVSTAVNSYMTKAKLTGQTISVVPSTPSSAANGDPVTVTVTIPFNKVSWLPTPMFLGGKTLTATSVMRRESAN